MENFIIKLTSQPAKRGHNGTLVGVVGSGNLEVLVEKHPEHEQEAEFIIDTSVKGFQASWQAVIRDFSQRRAVGGLKFSIHDAGASPSIVMIRLLQAIEAYESNKLKHQESYRELSARDRILQLVDSHSFHEWLTPDKAQTSPHLPLLDLPVAFDDGVIIGKAKLNEHAIYIAAQEAQFMGGAIGEVHGAKLTGLFLKAAKEKPAAVILLLDSGGVRLHEANAGETAIAEVIAALMKARFAGVTTIGIVAGKNGAFGGAGILSTCLDYLLISEEGRTGVSGPEVIETVMGTEEYDASDRALVWRTCGGKHRAIMGDALYIAPKISAIKAELASLLSNPQILDLKALKSEHATLQARLTHFANAKDGIDIWRQLGIEQPEQISQLSDEAFLALLTREH